MECQQPDSPLPQAAADDPTAAVDVEQSGSSSATASHVIENKHQAHHQSNSEESKEDVSPAAESPSSKYPRAPHPTPNLSTMLTPGRRSPTLMIEISPESAQYSGGSHTTSHRSSSGSFIDLGSPPSPSDRQPTSGLAQYETPVRSAASRSERESQSSGSDPFKSPPSPSESTEANCRRTMGATPFHSFPVKKKVTLTAPDSTSVPRSFPKSPAVASSAASASAGAIENSRRLAVPPVLDTISDASSTGSGPPTPALNPLASSFRLNSATAPFPPGCTYEYIITNGKLAEGGLSREAREALTKLGLKSIPSMHGPMNLPYARCPSGIDAFLFPLDKQEDPWTFVLDDARRRNPLHSSTNRGYRVPLPGNARYSQPSHLQKGLLPNNRNVSAPAALDEARQEGQLPARKLEAAADTAQAALDPEVSSVTVQKLLASSMAGAQAAALATAAVPEWTYEQWMAAAEAGFTDPSPFFMGQQAAPSFWSSPYLYTAPYYPPYPPAAAAAAAAAAATAAAVASAKGFQHSYPPDPAILSYGHAPASTQPASDVESSEDDAEPKLGGFYFPATAEGRSSSRRASSASQVTLVPPTKARRVSSSHPGMAPLAALIADRRNSVNATSARRASTSTVVTVSPRRSSVAPQTRLGRDPPPPPLTLIPHHSRPASLGKASQNPLSASVPPSGTQSRRSSQSLRHSRNSSVEHTASAMRSKAPAVALTPATPVTAESAHSDAGSASTTARDSDNPTRGRGKGRKGPRGRGRGRGGLSVTAAASAASPQPAATT